MFDYLAHLVPAQTLFALRGALTSAEGRLQTFPDCGKTLLKSEFKKKIVKFVVEEKCV